MFDFNVPEFSKWYAKNIKSIKSQLAKNAKQSKCMICQGECSSFCNSHSIPAFILRKLEEDGTFKNFVSLAKTNIIKPDTGLNKAGTFQLICKNCDNTFFKDYENPEIYNDLSIEFMQPILYQIAIKNLLFLINKTNNELSMLYATRKYLMQERKDILNLTDECFEKELFSRCKKLKFIEDIFRYDYHYCYKNVLKCFSIIFQKELPYQIPIAFQSTIPIHKGLNGEIINDFIDTIYYIHICAFPLQNNKSLLLIFCHESEDRYCKFKEEFNKLNLLEQLEIINFIIFSYSEDYFMCNEVYEKIKDDNVLAQVCKTIDFCDLSLKLPKIPNVLTRKYSMKQK